MRRFAAIIVLCILTLTVLAPFNVADRVVGSEPQHPVPAGEFVDGTKVLQEGDIPASNIIAELGRHLCFGIQFATYARTNHGALEITWRQGKDLDQWAIRSVRLKDNEFKYFCPSKGIAAGQKFEIAITGVGIKSGHAPTAWLTADTRFGVAAINGADQKRSLSLRFASIREVSPQHITALDGGAYFFGWLVSVLISVAALLAMRPPALS